MSDVLRTHISLKLQCYECGVLLKTSYEKPLKIESDYSKGEPTGACNRNLLLTVHPCDCTKKAEQDLNELKRLLK